MEMKVSKFDFKGWDKYTDLMFSGKFLDRILL